MAGGQCRWIAFGAVEDITGMPHHLLRRDMIRCKIRLREAREVMDECLGLFPSCPAVEVVPVNDTICLNEPMKAIWSEDWSGDERSKNNIYKRDRRTSFTLPKFLVWMCRMDGVAGIQENPKYSPPIHSDSYWVRDPMAWEDENNTRFGRWFWMHDAAS